MAASSSETFRSSLFGSDFVSTERAAVYVHLSHPPIERQPIGNEAKSFQVGQLKDMIAEFDLKLEKG